MTRYAREFRRVARSLSRVELMRSSMDDTFAITEQDLLDKDAGRRFLDFYGIEGIYLGLERYGFAERLRKRGYDEFHIETSAMDDRHTLLVDATSSELARDRIIELVVRRDCLRIEGFERTWEALTVDWLTLRHPISSFSDERLRLPGQDAPGLRLGERVLELLYRVVDRLRLDALLTVAEYFHNAVLYARELRYVDPFYAGQLMALERMLFKDEGLTLAQASWAVQWGLIKDATDAPFVWRGEAMVGAKEKELLQRLRSREHTKKARELANQMTFHLARDEFDERWSREWEQLLLPPEEDS